MPHVFTNGIRLSYERSGRGERVLMIMGSSAGGRVWTLHQTPALTKAGYQTITFDSRGIAPSDIPPGKYSLADMVADTKGLIEALDAGPCRIVGTSLGALIAQELAIGWPHLVRCAVLIGAKARSDAVRVALGRAERALLDSGVKLPAEYEAAMSVLQMLSPATINDDKAVSLWLETFRLSGGEASPGQTWIDTDEDRRKALRDVAAPCRVIAFADDFVTPPHLSAEVADAIPECDYVEIPECGHFGYLERPDEVNKAIIEFLDTH
ncbi:pimeloyl-ACP methyl ester carboxylesterase [Streptomyces sp. SAI-144]|uniref:alpha/beta fold hydrolase n=1 Tax=Streptomyces sp. SAI-144 TaxID=2940544 RepID=UPI002473773A|nr:alpha/beta hydrolase [Streptomyces sp. SAI-144]MDH6436335.1 pimeloyl-ACP methyl ester carboxylesterase [Streptomyces sp. SAI-144]